MYHYGKNIVEESVVEEAAMDKNKFMALLKKATEEGKTLQDLKEILEAEEAKQNADLEEEGVIGDFVAGGASMINKARNLFKDKGGIKAMDAVKDAAKKSFKKGSNDVDVKKLLKVASMSTQDPIELGSLLFGKEGAKALLANTDVQALGFVLGELSGTKIKDKKAAQRAVLYYIVQNHIMSGKVAKQAYTQLKRDFSSGETYDAVVKAFNDASKKSAGEKIIGDGEDAGAGVDKPWEDEKGEFQQLKKEARASFSDAQNSAYNAALAEFME